MAEKETGRELINSVVISTTTTGKPVAHLYSAQTQLQYPVLDLFDLSALQDLGIDPNTAPTEERIYCRAWAYYQLSDKRNAKGNPYRDVTHLQPLDNGQAAQATSDEVLAELRAIRQAVSKVLTLVQELRFEEPSEPTPPAEPVLSAVEGTVDDDPALRYGDGSVVADNQAEVDAFLEFLRTEHRTPGSIQELRSWKVARLNGKEVATG